MTNGKIKGIKWDRKRKGMMRSFLIVNAKQNECKNSRG